MKSIICGFAGIGKSTVARYEAGTVDLESTPFKKDWKLYVDVAEHMQKNGYQVLLSCHKELREELRKRSVKYYVVIPSVLDKENYLERYKNRNNTLEFIKMMDENWEKFLSEINESEENIVTLPINGYL